MYLFALITQIFTLIIEFCVILVIMKRKFFQGQVCFLASSFCVAIMTFGYLLELRSTSLDTVLIAIKVQYFGSCFVNMLSYYFILNYFGYKKNKHVFISLFFFNILILIAVCTCEYHTLYYSSMTFVQEGPFPHVELTHGVLYTAFKIEIFVMNLVVLFTLVHHFHTIKKELRNHELHFSLACLFPVGTCVLYSLGLFDVYDPSSASFVISGVLILNAIYRHELFDVIHTARDSVIETMEEPLVVVDTSYHLLDYNPAARTLFPELNYHTLNFQLSSISPFLNELFHNQISMEFEQFKHCYRAQINKIYDKESLVGYSAWIFDITESRNNMKNQIQLRQQAENANRAKSAFLANMSHEIRTPLNAILGITDIILNQEINYMVRSEVTNIKSAGNTLLNIINDVLDFSKIESGKMIITNEVYKLSSIMQDVVGIISVKLTKKPIILRVEISPKHPKFYFGDELRIRQLLINVLNNAVKFTAHGTITFSVDAQPIDNQENMINLVFKIKDTGRGINKEDFQRIFNSFEQADITNTHQVEGSGLGLAICRKLLDLMHGTISVESELNVGSTFTITIPQKVANEKDFAPLEPENELQLQESDQLHAFLCTALVIDDNILNLQVAKGLLELFDIKVKTANSGMAALELLKDQNFDIIFLDHMMPVMDGVETLRSIRSLSAGNCATVPIIALTANAVHGMKERFLAAGFTDYISKPTTLSALHIILNKWLGDKKVNYTIQEATNSTESKQYAAFLEFSKRYQIDLQSGLLNSGNQWLSYFETLNLFANDGLKQIKQITQALQQEDLPLYTVWMHGIKSSALTIGAKELSDQAAKLELASKTHSLTEFSEQNEAFVHAYRILCHAIHDFITSTECLKSN